MRDEKNLLYTIVWKQVYTNWISEAERLAESEIEQNEFAEAKIELARIMAL